MAVLQVQVQTEGAGTVLVKAKAAPGREMDAKPVAGFYIRRRYEGDQFKIADWKEFSPRWMEFVDTPPEGWMENINAREAMTEQIRVTAQAENSKTQEQRVAEHMFSMAQAANPAAQGVETINQATGRRTLSVPRAGA